LAIRAQSIIARCPFDKADGCQASPMPFGMGFDSSKVRKLL